MLPKVLAGCLIAAFVTILLPREKVNRWVGPAVRLKAHTRVYTTQRRDVERNCMHTVKIPDEILVVGDLACGGKPAGSEWRQRPSGWPGHGSGAG